MKNIEKLSNIGFIIVGEWKYSIKSEKELEFKIFQFENEANLLYAFESDGQVHYIGKTEKTLKERMSNYKAGRNLTAGSTNKLVHKNILNLINKGKKINIHILLDNANLSYHGIKISLPSGLESNLIQSFNEFQLWNSRNNFSSIKEIDTTNSTVATFFENQSNIFQLKLSKEYYNKGVISIPKRFKNHVLDTKGVQIKLIIENEKNIILPTYTISGENMKINGKSELMDWFKKHFQLNDIVNIEIISPKEFRVYK
jgi:hypothetical protein